MKLIITTAVQILHQDGPRTRERLDYLVKHWHFTYALPEENLARLQEEAWQEHLAREAQERGS